jgi:alpha-L-fucosidase
MPKSKPLAHLLELLVGAAGRDGNMLLNVGPRPDGKIDPAQEARLREIGQWLSLYGEGIYGTRGGPWLPGTYGVSTHNGNRVYVHVLHPSQNFTLVLPTLPAHILKAEVLHGSGVPFQQTVRTLTLNLPQVPPDTIDIVVKLELAEPWTTCAVVPVPAQ